MCQSFRTRVETCLPFSNINQKDQSSYRQHNLPSACGSSKTFPPQSASHFGFRNTLNRCSGSFAMYPGPRMENHGKASQFLPNTTGRRWIKRGVVHPNSIPTKVGRYVATSNSPNKSSGKDVPVFQFLNLLQSYFPKRSRHCLLPDALSFLIIEQVKHV